MEKLIEFYQEMGVSPAVYAYGEAALDRLKDRFDAIDKIAEYNQAKVLSAMQVVAMFFKQVFIQFKLVVAVLALVV